jgi:hypothetical protein
VFDLLISRGVRSVDEPVLDSLVSFLFEGKPLEGEGGPLEFLDHKSVIEIAAVLHPYFVFLFGSEVVLIHLKLAPLL